MPFPGTDIDAYIKARKGKTKKQRSKIYHKEKAKNLKKSQQSNFNWEPPKLNTSKPKTFFPKKKVVSITKPTLNNNNQRSINENTTSKPVKRQITFSRTQIEKENNKLFKQFVSKVENTIKDKLIDFTLEIIKEHVSKDVQDVIETYQTIQKYIKIANKIYKIIIKLNKHLDIESIKYEKKQNNFYTRYRFNKDYQNHKKTYESYNDIFNNHTYLLNDLEEWCLGDTKEMANQLFELVKSGIKTATSYLCKEKNHDNKFSILTNWDKSEKLLLETISINIVEFKNVSEEHAFKEGENDRTLENWKTIHKDFFENESKKNNIIFTDETKIVCEEFKVLQML